MLSVPSARVAVTLRGCFIPNYLRGFRVFDMIVFINLSLSAWVPPLRNVFLSKIRIAAAWAILSLPRSMYASNSA